MRISLIVAVAENGVIGRDGDLPWRLSADLQRFKRLTMGHHLIMGRKTFEAIGRVLPGRTTIVVTRQSLNGDHAGVLFASDLEHALQLAGADNEVFVVGGGEIYCQMLPRADRVYLTRVHTAVAGDTTFPTLDERRWRLVEEQSHSADAKNEFPFTFQIYEQVTNDGNDQA